MSTTPPPALPGYAETLLGLPPGQFPFQSRFHVYRGCRLHYIDEGSGPVLFMIHGNPAWSFLFRKIVLALRGRFRCIAIDLPGFGLSRPGTGFDYRPESHQHYVVALLRHLDIRDAALVAHDWGGPIGLAAAVREPERLTRFVLGNTWAWPVNGIRHFEWFSWLMGGPVGRWAAPRYNLFVNGVMPGSMRRGPMATGIHDAYKAPFRHSRDWTGTHVFPACITDSHEFLGNVEAGIRTLPDARFLFLWPDKDVAFRARELARWQELLPAATVVPIANCGHYLWEEAPDDVVAALTAWHPGC